MIQNCFKATQKKDNTRVPRAIEGESNTLARRKAVVWLLVKVGVQKTPEGCQENWLNLISMAFWAIL